MKGEYSKWIRECLFLDLKLYTLYLLLPSTVSLSLPVLTSSRVRGDE